MINIISGHTTVSDLDIYYEYTKDHLDGRIPDFINGQVTDFRNIAFHHKLYNMITKDAKILDIGCGHGESVEDFIIDGYCAVGIDVCPLFRQYSPIWKNVNDNLFCCDVGKPFHFVEDDNLIKFDVITSWECFEHVKTDDIDQLIENVDNNSKSGTLLILSIGNTDEMNHRTLRPKQWWLEKLNKIHFVEKDMNFGNDLIRNLGGISDYFFMVKK